MHSDPNTTIGYRCRLKSGSPVLTVVDILAADRVTVAWVRQDGRIDEADLMLSTLEPLSA